MLLSFNLALTLGVLVHATSLSFKLGGFVPEPFQEASPDVATSNTISLTRKQGSASRAYLGAIKNRADANGVYGSAPLKSAEEGQEFLAPITFGTQSFMAILDSGSSDTWLAETGFQCLNLTTNVLQPEAECDFGPLYSRSTTFTPISDENFNVSYADGEFLTGTLGNEHVTIAGITVDKQEVGVVNFAAWEGDGISSGLIGLAFPSLTSAFSGQNPSLDTNNTQLPYNPILTSIYAQGKVAPVFSLALTRGATGGTFAVGGLPQNVAYTNNFATSPFQVLTMEDDVVPSASTKPQYQFYTITIQGFEILGARYTYYSHGANPNPAAPPNAAGNEQVIVDSGTSLLYVASEIAYIANELFSPSAQFDEESGIYFVACNAVTPTFGVNINGQTFFINSQDLVIDAGDGSCVSGIQDAGEGPGILGDVFLKNVLAVFDIGASQMRFAARENY